MASAHRAFILKLHLNFFCTICTANRNVITDYSSNQTKHSESVRLFSAFLGDLRPDSSSIVEHNVQTDHTDQ